TRSDRGTEALPPDAPLQIDPAERVAEVRELVCERHLRREERVRRVLDHLRGPEVRREALAPEASVPRAEGGPGPPIEGPDHNSVRLRRVREGRPLPEKLRVHAKPEIPAR